jgi:hypothetical protein
MTDACQRRNQRLGEPLERCILPAGHADGCWFQPIDPGHPVTCGARWTLGLADGDHHHICTQPAGHPLPHSGPDPDRPEPPQQPGPRFRPPSAQRHGGNGQVDYRLVADYVHPDQDPGVCT